MNKNQCWVRTNVTVETVRGAECTSDLERMTTWQRGRRGRRGGGGGDGRLQGRGAGAYARRRTALEDREDGAAGNRAAHSPGAVGYGRDGCASQRKASDEENASPIVNGSVR